MKTFKITILLFITTLSLFAQNNDGLISHWIFNKENSYKGTFKDLAGTSDAKMTGRFQLIDLGDTEAYKFDGVETTGFITDDISSAKLPKGAFSVSAWVLMKKSQDYTGILGAFQDNGDFEKGWVVGFMKKRFGLALATKGTDDGNGLMTYLVSEEKVQMNKWYHVAATYDKKEIKLYLNGVLVNQSSDQSRDILYPEEAVYTIGAYKDKNENFVLNGAMLELKLYDIAIDDKEIKEQYEEKKWLTKLSTTESINSNFVVLPYLQQATKTSICVLWETKETATSIVQYGEILPFSDKVENKDLSKMHEVKLTNLKPEMNYFYRVRSVTKDGKEEVSEVYTFQTAVNDDTPILIGLVSDTQNNPKVWGKISDMVFAERPNFVLHAGDIVGDGTKKHEWVEEFLAPSQNLMSRIPIYTSIGNHERNADNFYNYMSNPEPEYYYSFEYGNSQFYMIDSNKDLVKDSDQYKLIENDLKNSTKLWKIAVFHHPPYSSDENDYGDTYRGKSTKGDTDLADLVKLFEQYNMDVVINGHIHTYERTLPIRENKIDNKNGITYIVLGGAGGGLENAAPTRNWFMAKVKRDHHFGTILINENILDMSAYDIDGRLFDKFQITK